MSGKIETILLRAKKDIYSYLSGSSISKILGEGYDFAELQEYQTTDDIRHISWLNSAKSDKIYTKKMHEEKELNIAVVSLIDGRFAIGDKLETLSYIVALLGYSANALNDSFLSMIIRSKETKVYPFSKNIKSIEDSIKELDRVKLLGTAIDYTKAPQKIMQTIESKSLLFIVGDFLDEIDLSILSQKHEVIIVIVRDRWEENPIVSPSSQLINPQTNQPINQIASKRAIKHYRDRLKRHDEKLIHHLNRYKIRYIKVYSMDEVIGGIEFLLSQ